MPLSVPVQSAREGTRTREGYVQRAIRSRIRLDKTLYEQGFQARGAMCHGHPSPARGLAGFSRANSPRISWERASRLLGVTI